MKKLRNVMRKCMASLLVLCMAAAPCVTEIGSVFAEPDTDTDIEPVAYKVTLNDAQNGKVSFKDSEERTHSYKEGDKVALKVQADDGYTLEKLSVMNADKEIASKTDGTSFSFTMPAADLTVNASFKAAEKQKAVVSEQSTENAVKQESQEPQSQETTNLDLSNTQEAEFRIEGNGSLSLTGADGKEVKLDSGKTTMKMPVMTYIHMVANSKTSTKITVTLKDSNDIVLEDPSTETGTSSWRDISLTGGSKKIVTVSFGNSKSRAKVARRAVSGIAAQSADYGIALQSATPSVGQKFTGSCIITGVNQSHAGGTVHSVSIKCNSGVLNGVSATTGCADHTASAPSVGEAFTYVFTVTNVNESTGVVTGNVYCTAVKGSTDGVHKNEHGLIGTQRVQGTASYVGQFNGKAKLKKSSSNTTLVTGNPCYSLTGASYGVYSDAGCTSQKATFTTNENGDSNVIDVPAGKYYVKEITAPKGYYKDNTVYPLTVTSGQTATVSVTDKPGDDPAAITINKKDSEVPENGIAIGGASLEGAQFTVKYYAGYYTKDNLPENATKTWVLETKKRTRSDGTIVYQTGLTEAYKVSGDDFFLVDGLPTLPLGTISITETKAPKGYSLDNAYLTPVGSTDKSSTYVAQITMDSDAVHLQGGNEYEMNDHVLRGDFEFTKKDEEDKTPMANIPFKITSKTTGESHKIVTDENGYYSSASEFNKHSQDTNGGKKDSGLWFGQYKVGDETKITDPDDTKGALPYDTYEIEELKCDANEGKALYKGTLTITRDGYKIDMGTIENADLTLQTTAKDEASNTHYAATDDAVTLVDTVSYTGLKKGKTYTLKGKLMNQKTGEALLDADGKEITSEKKFTPKTAEGSTEVEFDFDASKLAGCDVTVFEYCYLDDTLITSHEDINDQDQTVHFPSIGTTAKDSTTDTNISKADGKISIVDTVKYTNLKVGKKYKVTGKLMDKATEKVVKDADGNEVTAETTFVVKESNGSVKVTFTFDGSKLAGKTVVAFEDIYQNGKLYASHADINDEGQTIHIPKIGTTAKDNKTKEDISYAEKEVTIVDTVKYTNLVPGKSYVMEGTLMNKETGKALEVNGKTVTASKAFTPDSADGSVDIVFTFDGSALAGKTVVAFEDLKVNKISVATHADIKDENQSVHFPQIKTTAKDSETKIGLSKADNNVTITDTVSYKNLVPNKEYTMTGRIMDQTTGQPLVVNGKEVTSFCTFTPKAEDGTVDVTFNFDASNLAGKSVVVFEQLYRDKAIVASHEDIKDEGQTVHFPEVHTTAKDSETKNNLSKADDKVTIIDTVKYTNLIPGKQYQVHGTLMDKETGNPLTVNDQEVTATKTFTPDKADGSVDLTFVFDGSALAGKSIVAFEDVQYEGKSVGTHADINDKDQTIDFPKIQTTAADEDTAINLSKAEDLVVIHDTVSYENLTPGREYELKGKLMDQTTGEVLQAKVVESFTNSAIKSDQELYKLKAGSYVYVEKGTDEVPAGIYSKTEKGYLPVNADENATPIAIDDALITWSGSFKKDVTAAIDNHKVYDINKITNYKFSEEKKDVTGSTKFTPTESNGTVDVTFMFDGSELKGKSTVAFEDLTFNEVSIAEHTDIKDEGQTVHYPEIKTTAKDSETGSHTSMADNDVTVVDTVKYTNLIPNKEYKIAGKLMVKETKEPLLVDGKEVTASTTFTPEKADGSIDLTFKFDGSALKGQTLVVFEDVLYEDVSVGSHEDINDTDQSIYFPNIGTTATDKADGDHSITAAKQVTIVDKVEYKNLAPGEKHHVKGTLMDKATGKALMVNGKEVTAEAEFTPDKSEGSVNVEFTFNAKDLGGKDLVVFEKMYDANGNEVANHEDINDEGQTVKIVKAPVTPSKTPVTPTKVQTGDHATMYVLLGVAVILLLGGGVMVFKKKKK